MTVSKERKAELIAAYGKNAQDSGSAAVQVALLTERIKGLTDHMKSHKKDFHTRRGLLMLVGQRRRLLSYIKKSDINEYRELIARLGIRDNIQELDLRGAAAPLFVYSVPWVWAQGRRRASSQKTARLRCGRRR